MDKVYIFSHDFESVGSGVLQDGGPCTGNPDAGQSLGSFMISAKLLINSGSGIILSIIMLTTPLTIRTNVLMIISLIIDPEEELQ